MNEIDIKNDIILITGGNGFLGSHTVDIFREKPYFECCESPEIIQCRGNYVCKNCAVVHEPIMRYTFQIKTVESHYLKKRNEYGCRTTFSLENCNPKNK